MTPLGRSRYQTSEFLNTSEFPTESPTHTPHAWQIALEIRAQVVRVPSPVRLLTGVSFRQTIWVTNSNGVSFPQTKNSDPKPQPPNLQIALEIRA